MPEIGGVISMFWEALNSAGRFAAAAASSGTTEQTMNDVIDSATEVTAEAGEEVNQFIRLFQDNLPDIIAFGIRVLLALVFFFIAARSSAGSGRS